MDELNPNDNLNRENEASDSASENPADVSEQKKHSNGSFYDNYFNGGQNLTDGPENPLHGIPEENTENTDNSPDNFAEADIENMFHYPPKGTLPPPGYGSVNYGAGYGGSPYIGQGGYQNPNMNPQNPYAPYNNGQGGYTAGGSPNYGYREQNYPNGGTYDQSAASYNQTPPYVQNTYNPYGGSSVYMPKKKGLSNGALMGIVITVSVLFIIILVVLAFTSIESDRNTDYSSQSGETEGFSGSETKSNVSVQIPIQSKPELEEKYYEDEETGLLTVQGVAKRVSPSVVDVLVYRDTSLYAYSAGSGIIISDSGYIVTNAHVITEANAGLKVTLGDGSEYEAEIVGADTQTDIAVLKIEAENLVAADFGDSDELELGEMVVAIGNAGGYSGTLTVGYVSGLNREIKTKSSTGSTMTCIQTDAAMSPGVSGGALINMYGQVVGITSSKYKSTELDEGIGFAITTKFAKPIIEDIISKGYISGRVRIGITYVVIDEEMADALNVKRGIQVKTIDSSCDISKTELKEGDIIMSINGSDVYSAASIKKAMEGIEPNDIVTAHVYRKGITSDDEEEFDIEFLAMQDTSLS